MDWGKFIRVYVKHLWSLFIALFLMLFGSFDSWNIYFRGWIYSTTGRYITLNGWIFAVIGFAIIPVWGFVQLYHPRPSEERVTFDFWEPIEIENNQIRIPVIMEASPAMLFQSLELVIQKKHIKANDWQPIQVDRLGSYFYFTKPQSIKEGKYQVRLIALVGGLPRFSDKFDVFIKGGSQS